MDTFTGNSHDYDVKKAKQRFTKAVGKEDVNLTGWINLCTRSRKSKDASFDLFDSMSNVVRELHAKFNSYGVGNEIKKLINKRKSCSEIDAIVRRVRSLDPQCLGGSCKQSKNSGDIKGNSKGNSQGTSKGNSKDGRVGKKHVPRKKEDTEEATEKEAAAIIQKVERVNAMRKKKAAAKLQGFGRGIKLRRKMTAEKVAAAIIQKVGRGNAVRKKKKKKKQKKPTPEGDKKSKYAVHE